MIAQYTTSRFAPLPVTTPRTVSFAPCPVCGKTAFNHVNHRRNHIAKCEAAALDEAQALGIFECEELLDLLPAPMVAAAHHALPMEDPAPAGHLAAAAQVRSDALTRLAKFLADADLSTGFYYSEIQDARTDLETAGDYIGDDDATCRRYWAIDDALVALKAWQDANEGLAEDAPDWSWDREVERALSDALAAVQWIWTNRPVHTDSARWTQGGWDRIDAMVRAEVAA